MTLDPASSMPSGSSTSDRMSALLAENTLQAIPRMQTELCTIFDSAVQSNDSAVQSPGSAVQSTDSAVQSPESAVQSTNSAVQSPDSVVQSTDSASQQFTFFTTW